MASYSKFNQFVADLAHGVHDFSNDTLKIALCNSSNNPVATNSTLSDLTTVSLTNLVNDVLTIDSEGQTSGTYRLILEDMELEASGGSVGAFRSVVIYNDTPTSPADPLICWFNLGENFTITNGNKLILDFSQVSGLFDLV